MLKVRARNELGNEVIAWMPLPEPWKGADDELL